MTRAESKSITRKRLLEAAAKLLAEQGSAALSASAVARAAKIAQPTFYVHFRDKQDLLETLAQEQIAALRARSQEAREAWFAGDGVDAMRAVFRLPLATWLRYPELLQLHARELHQPGSPFGKLARQLRDEIAADLVADLVRLGIPARKKLDRERVRMIADAFLAQIDALAFGLIEGRYSSLETAIDVLTGFALSLLSRVEDADA